MSQADNSVDKTSLRDSIPGSHQPTSTLLQQLIGEPAPDAEVGIKWGSIAYDLAITPQSMFVLRFSPSAEVPLETLRKVMTDVVERKRAG